MRGTGLLGLRMSLFAAMGLGAIACNSTVTVQGGSGGAGSGASGPGSTTVGPTTTIGAGGGTVSACVDSQPLLDASGNWTGYERCADGTVHRVQAIAVDPIINAPLCDGSEEFVECGSDADCADGTNGRCVQLNYPEGGPGPGVYCGCAYACASDADCSPDSACVPPGVVPDDSAWARCVPARCGSDGECASGECGIDSLDNGCYFEVALECRSGDDACRLDSDCFGEQEECVASHGAGWQCRTGGCDIGRPLMVDGAARTAKPVRRDDWCAAVVPELDRLSSTERETLGQRWLEGAAFEHASIASFARFTLELLSLGAPPELVADAQRAALDEVEHARISYAIASACLGRPCGPGPLDLGAVTFAADRAAVIRSLVHEACVSETIGVAEALALAERAASPVLREAHARIAADETRHAELAWRTLAWLLDGADDATRALAAAALQQSVAAFAREASEERRAALHEVVVPCAQALLARSGLALHARLMS